MLYTGTSGSGPTSKQRIGLATSSDLTNWTRYPGNHCPGSTGDGCVYECDESWTTWGDANESYDQQCRDPFVIWDDANGRWVMFVTAIEVQVIDGDKWIMSQSISNPKSGDHDAHRRDLRLKCIVWGANFDFDTHNVAYPYPRRGRNVHVVHPTIYP